MRTSMMTGLYPHQTDVQSNEGTRGFTPVGKLFMGNVFKQAGYSTAYFGKWHIPLSTKATDVHGFDIFVENAAQLDPKPAADFLRQKHEKPFFVFASFLSPHEVCEYARKQKLPGGEIGDPPPLEDRPPMRSNSEPQTDEPDIMTAMRKSFQASSKFPVGDYTDEDWRRLAWGYYRLVERADKFAGVLLDALRESGKEKETIVVFLSDHGECLGAHRWNQKTVFYEESVRIPFIISQKGTTKKGTSDLLVNVGIDLLPTLCDLAGIKPPPNLPGMSMKAPALGQDPDRKREYVVSENHMVQGSKASGVSVQPHGRMVRSEQYKYCLYSEGQQRESLVDLKNDPGERVNQAANPEFASVLQQHRAFLRQHAEKGDDKKALEMLGYLK
jgi:arylsulfatase A-like enzyme